MATGWSSRAMPPRCGRRSHAGPHSISSSRPGNCRSQAFGKALTRRPLTHLVRDPAYRARRVKDAQEAAALAKMPNPQAFVKSVEDSVGIEEASLVKEVSPASGSGKGLADARRALSEVTDRIAELSPADQAAPSCYAEKATTIRGKFPSVSRRGLPSARAAELQLFQQDPAAFDTAGRDHHADHALLRHRQQIQPRGQLDIAVRVPRQSRADRDTRQGRAPGLGTLSSSPDLRQPQLVFDLDLPHRPLQRDAMLRCRLGDHQRDVFAAAIGVLHRDRHRHVEDVADLLDADDRRLWRILDPRGHPQFRQRCAHDPLLEKPLQRLLRLGLEDSPEVVGAGFLEAELAIEALQAAEERVVADHLPQHVQDDRRLVVGDARGRSGRRSAGARGGSRDKSAPDR